MNQQNNHNSNDFSLTNESFLKAIETLKTSLGNFSSLFEYLLESSNKEECKFEETKKVEDEKKESDIRLNDEEKKEAECKQGESKLEYFCCNYNDKHSIHKDYMEDFKVGNRLRIAGRKGRRVKNGGPVETVYKRGDRVLISSKNHI